MQAIARLKQRYERTEAAVRARFPAVDHLFRTKQRYGEVLAGRLAAGMSYYGFFAVFALGVVAYSILGFLVEYHVNISNTVDEFLSEDMPVLSTSQISAGRGAAGLFGLVGLLATGLAWVEAVRSSQRLVWQVEQEPGSAWLRRLVDVLVLGGLALLLCVSFAAALGLEALLSWLPVVARKGLALVLTVGVNMLLAVALLAAVPRLRIPLRRLLIPALLVAVGLYALNTLGQEYISRVQHNAAYAVVATAAGVLVYLYLFHQILLAAAALAATDRRGEVADLATRRRRPARATVPAHAG